MPVRSEPGQHWLRTLLDSLQMLSLFDLRSSINADDTIDVPLDASVGFIIGGSLWARKRVQGQAQTMKEFAPV